jgi:hypothetical protein
VTRLAPVGQLSDPYQQGEDDELGITISGLPGEPDDQPDEVDDAVAAAVADAVDGAEAPGEAAGPAAGDGDDGAAVEFDLADWSEIERQAITERLREAGIPHGWDGTSLQVAAVDEAPVENVLDIVEGEAGPPLDSERDQVAYDLSEWDDDQIAVLAHELREADIAYAWDGDELYVYAEAEQAVDDLFDRVSHPHELPAEDDDGAPSGELLGEVFVAADRLRRDGEDNQGTRALLDLREALDGSEAPYGLGKPEWTHLCERVDQLGALLEGETVDEDAVVESARDLLTALRPYV